MRYPIDADLPPGIRPPLRFREPGHPFEGEVAHPRDLVHLFETTDTLAVDRNEYPRSRARICYVVHAP